MSQKIRIAMTLMFGMIASTAWPTSSQAAKYTAAQVEAIISTARNEAIKKATSASSTLKSLKSKESSLNKTLDKKRCTTREFKLLKIRNEYCIRYSDGTAKLYRNGKFVPVLDAAAAAVRSLKDFVSNAKKEVEKAASSLKQIKDDLTKETKKIADKAGKTFDSDLSKFKKIAKTKVDEAIRQKKAEMVYKIAKLLAKKLSAARQLGQSKLQSPLKKTLRNKSYQQVKLLMQGSQATASAARVYAKTAALSIAVSATFLSAKIAVICWKYDGTQKRNCLENALASGIQDFLFTTASSLVLIGLDLAVIEPFSHTIAATASIALASASAGVGAASYPIVYLLSSVGSNVAVYAYVYKELRPKYDEAMASKRDDLVSLSKTILNQIPNSSMKCWAPDKKSRKAICANP